ncbi:MAG: hypothetical protein LBH82_07480 [Bacteroidales bacterium]|jgi:hypothetical protein|nr:hypothetical protein [Bacteroidales bacterium]
MDFVIADSFSGTGNSEIKITTMKYGDLQESLINYFKESKVKNASKLVDALNMDERSFKRLFDTLQ